ncbi:DUF4386 family protein [Calditrichota bacterium LG25]
MLEIPKKSLRKSLVVTGLIFTIVIFLWPAFMAISALDGSVEMQLQQIRQNPVPFRLNFVLASFIAPSLAALLITVGLFFKTRKTTPVLTGVGLFFLLPYVVFVSIAYATQFTLVANSLLNGNFALARQWYFGNFYSVAYFLNQLGYAFFALSGVCLGYRFLFEKGAMRLFGWLLYGSSILSIAAFIGLAINSKGLNSVTVLSGLCVLPLGIIAIISGLKLRKEIS